jgi:signal transduction histidine kinase
VVLAADDSACLTDLLGVVGGEAPGDSGAESAMGNLALIPLRSRQALIGVLGVWRPAGGGRYTDDEVSLLQDLAGRAAIALENAQLYAQARQAIELRDEFLSVAAHELKTPLTGLQGNVQLLLHLLHRERTVDFDDLHRRLVAINTQSGKLGRLIEHLLDISRLEAGRLSLDRREGDLTELVQSVAAAPALRNVPHPITVQVPAEPVQAEVDPLRLEQVLTNLVDNAIKYSPAGGEIVVTLAVPEGQRVEIRVRDHGLGIPPDHRGQIFDRFYQAHTGQHYGGMGLGLYICRQIVELHGGTIHAEFPDDGGTCLVVTLPLARRG